MPAINIVDKVQAIQYTGSNSAEIDAAIPDFAVVSQSGGILTMESPVGSSTYTVGTNGWIRFTQGYVVSTHTNSEFTNFYIQNAVYGDASSLDSRVDALETSEASGKVIAVGVKETPTLLLSQTTNVAVDIVPAPADTSYTANVQLVAASSLLGSLSVTSVTKTDADTVTVAIQNSGLVNISGVHVVVIASE